MISFEKLHFPSLQEDVDRKPEVRTSGNTLDGDAFDMATGADQAVGLGLVGLSLFLFTYYTIWVIVLCISNDNAYILNVVTHPIPFVDSGHAIHSYFLPLEYSVILPGIAALILLLCVGTFIGIITWKNRKPKKVE